MYKVIKSFTDIQDEGYVYKVGDEYPRRGLSVKQARIDMLASGNNRQKTPLIVADKKVLKEDLNPAIPAQPEKVEQETPLMDEVEKTETIEEPIKEKKSTSRRKNNKE